MSAPRKGKLRLATPVAAALVALGATGTAHGAPPPPDLRSYYHQSVAWSDCPGQEPGTARCADVTVPLDYAHPGDRTLGIAVSKLKATGPGPRLGSLLVNFGGPGLPGIGELAQRAPDLAALNRQYDLIGFDPRGVGRSAPVDCGDLSRITRPAQLARACARTSGWLLPYLSTPDTARDLDVVRGTLGDDKLSYLGFSYGSTLGAVYAHEFPTRVGRIALDGVPDPTLDDAGAALAQARAFQTALTHFAADCAARGCPVPGRTGAQVLAGITAGVRHFAHRPLATDQGDLDRVGYLQGLQNALYSKDTWPYLREALGDLRKGDGDLMMRLAYPGSLGQSVADWGDHPQDNLDMAKLAIDCRDTDYRPTPGQLHRLDARFTAASPLFGRDIEATLLSCTGWPRGTPGRADVAAPTAPQTLLVSTTGDPATPYRGAFHMAAALRNDSRVLTYRGEGHGALFAHNPCVTRTVTTFFLSGTLPRPPATC